jgi:hypothetical protein
MTDICDPSCGDNDREKEEDAPATANSPSVWRSLWALSSLWLGYGSRRRKARRSARLHRLNAYMLRDIGVDHDGFVVLNEGNNYR